MIIADENNAGTEQSSADTENENASTAAQNPEERRPRRRGFAAMDRERVKEIASKGGKAAHAAGTAHQFTSDEARIAGRKGGMAPHVRRGGVRRRPETSGSGQAQQSQSQGQGQGQGQGESR